MLHYSHAGPRVCEIEVSTKSNKWTTWNSKNVKKIEEHIKYDLEYDGYQVILERVSKPGKTLCSKPFTWKLEIDVETLDDDAEQPAPRVLVGSRFKVARSDAKVKTIQSQIEKVFGLPKGCVCLLTPENKKSNPRSSIKKLRRKWKTG
ncbi:hypothetical protein MLC59_11970 [Marinobacter bryozoorum]|uniref:hypothetical protein n=1 Tax=Marinobacter bryozoorum TaxID=256324 RepID=UPI00200626E8|nr:hypothetical protein [Marinobacter bryozoorum]MCK7544878.1 hypothetical protein [Marinobacter bryozoorum]